MDRLPFRATPLASPTKVRYASGGDSVGQRAQHVQRRIILSHGRCRGREKLLLTGITACPPKSGFENRAGAEETVRWEHARDPMPVLDGLRERV
jgi:hypothetical protein